MPEVRQALFDECRIAEPDALGNWDAALARIGCIASVPGGRRPGLDAILAGTVTSLFHYRGLPAAVVAIGFALMARAMGSVTDGGALVGVLVAFVLMLAGGFAGFVPLAAVFLLTYCQHPLGYARKQTTGRGGARARPQRGAGNRQSGRGDGLCPAR